LTTKIALAHLADSRDDFYLMRQPLVQRELGSLQWLVQECDVLESPVIRSNADALAFSQQVHQSNATSLVIHLPVWADPIFSIKLMSHVNLPVMLAGNTKPDTSSIVGILGAGGALNQAGFSHVRLFDHETEKGRIKFRAFLRAADAVFNLKGKTLGLFGGRSLGISTAQADVAQWNGLFGVDIEMFDQLEIVQVAEDLDAQEVERHFNWLVERVGGLKYEGIFNKEGLERQVRSYLATRILMLRYGLDFLGVKCQPELSDGYVSQCVAHMLMNGDLDADGLKMPVVHACESDADGALSMQILQLVSGGKPTALLDVRWFDQDNGLWSLANCGALAASFYATVGDPHGFSQIKVMPHVFGLGGGGAFPALVAPQKVTLIRLCRERGQYWMAILSGDVEQVGQAALAKTTSAFPQAYVRTQAGLDFLERYGSNHIHMVSGNYVEEVIAFCNILNIPWTLW
jgi:L-fucose isomerase